MFENKNDLKSKLYYKDQQLGYKNFNIDNPKTWCEKCNGFNFMMTKMC